MVTETAALRSVDDHLSRILAVVAPLPAYDQPLLEALGLPLGEDVRAAVDLPNFDNSAMDGYAVRAVDVAAATGDKPVRPCAS
jgi:molybdopterin molybdotransferase